MSEPYIGEIEYFAFGFAPKGWLQCAGQFLSINQNQALFSLIGVTFGGDGRTTFALPNLQSRIAVGMGVGGGLSAYTLGQLGGQETVALQVSQMPSHAHQVNAVSNPPAVPVAAPDGRLLSVGTTTGGAAINVYATGATTGVMAPGTIGNSSGGQGHENRMPYLTLLPCIATAGIFPSRP